MHVISFKISVIFVHQVLTKDSVTVSVDAVVYYRISNATVSVANVENAHHSTRLLAQTTLRNVLGTKNLSEILSEREAISNSMQVRWTEKKDSKSRILKIQPQLQQSNIYIRKFKPSCFGRILDSFLIFAKPTGHFIIKV